ncbi:HAD family hydrolase [Clostridium thermarum]|uniref:HAD family hydrolase n=1 Tax=Clostridium thermarum TaxID=1716543 RepID=UPI0013D63D5E|nr:hypothetical protein [Clostridium thermarum]
MNIYEMIDKAEVVSFDIFDTLIKRYVNDPKEIFTMVEIIYNQRNGEQILNFKKERTMAERRARRKSIHEELSIIDIYRELRHVYKEAADILMKLEIECEINLTGLNQELKPVYDYCINKKKKVIVTSDMYLTSDTLRMILNKNGIVGFDRLYVSSEYKLTKYTGRLYSQILKELDCHCKSILHIGDNYKSDFKNASKIGINAYHFKGFKENHKKIVLEEEVHAKKVNVINQFINDKLKNKHDRYFYNFGYKNLGILLYGFLQWIHNQCKRHNVHKILFFSRDGYFMKKAYIEKYIIEDKIPCDYMYVSRRSLIVPSLTENISSDELINILGLRKKDTIESFFKRIGLDVSKYQELISNCNYKVTDAIDLENKRESFDKLFNLIRKDIAENAFKERQALVKYIKYNGFDNSKIAVVDIGWRGSMQYFLMETLKSINMTSDINGFYLGLNRAVEYFIRLGMKAKGYIFFGNKRGEYEIKTSSFVGLMESLFMAPHGTVLGYKDLGDRIEPILDDLEYSSKDVSIISEIQEGALKFIEDFSKFNSRLNIIIEPEVAFYNLSRALCNPSLDLVNRLGDVCFSDFDNAYLAKPHSLGYYILKPKSFLKDFFTSQWKAGYLKRLFKISLPYYSIYKFTRRIYEKRGKKLG